MPKVLVVFALKQEFAPWRRQRHFQKSATSPHPIFMTAFGATEVYVALAGAGAPDAHLVQDLTAHVKPTCAVVTGVAAGLKREWRPGDLLVAQSVSGPDGAVSIASAVNLVDLGVQCGAKRARNLVTLRRIARTVAEKEDLAKAGDAADMESLPLMQQWSSCGVPSVALRVILDPLEMPMTCDFEAAMDSRGQVRIAKILAQLARHPQRLPDFLHLAAQSRRALSVLAHFLDHFFDALDRQSPATGL